VEFFIGIAIVVIGLAAFELFEGFSAMINLSGDDEEIFAPLAVLSLLVFVAGLSYFG
tara:strand:+ start:744 stop:914 length:171 start_codon:yes stop_codon:yes gene_type:complete